MNAPLVQARDLARTFDVSPPLLERPQSASELANVHRLQGVTSKTEYTAHDLVDFSRRLNRLSDFHFNEGRPVGSS